MTKSVFIVGHGDRNYANLFLSLGYSITDNPDEASLACFTGGADVSPELYGAHAHPYTGTDRYRDVQETASFHSFLERNVTMVGICRGAQFLNVMSGGAMYQHVEGHTRSHEITDVLTGDVVYVSSTHHQMMKPSSKAVLVASSTLGGRREWYEGEIFHKDVSDKDIEVVYYEHTRCLCFQPHPEFDAVEYEGMKSYFNSLLERYHE